MFIPCWSCDVYHNRQGHLCWVCEQLAYMKEDADKPRTDSDNRRGSVGLHDIPRAPKGVLRRRPQEETSSQGGSDVPDPQGGGSES